MNPIERINASDVNYQVNDSNLLDVKTDTESMLREVKIRLHAQSSELKRFHDRICVRVTARERQHRLEHQRAQNYLDEKCAKLLCATNAIPQTRKSLPARVSTRPSFQKLKEDKRAILKDCPLGKRVEKCMYLDAQIRDELLQSIQVSRSDMVISEECENDRDASLIESVVSPVLRPEQRVALYATVRRQYMEMNRSKAQNTSRSISQKAESPPLDTAIAASVRCNQTNTPDRELHGERWATIPGVKVVDMTSGCHTRVHRQATTSSTPWRKKPAKASVQPATTEQERFLCALQAQLGTPALCSCAKTGLKVTSSSQSCANNCALYKQPQKRDKLLANVYKQQQQDTTQQLPLRPVHQSGPLHH